MAKTIINAKGRRVFADNPNNLFYRWVAKKKYGDDWREEFEVHHIDGDRLNDDDSNLIQMGRVDHHHLHQHENKQEFLSGLIIASAIAYFIALVVFGFLIPSLSQAGRNITTGAVSLIFVLAMELRYGIIAKTIRRPNERVFKEEIKEK